MMSKFLDHSWISFQGKLTPDNRDCYGASAQAEKQCFVIADGSTSSLYGAETAQAITREVIECFNQDAEGFGQDEALACLKELQSNLKMKYTSGVASYAIVILSADKVKVIWAGDCCLGNLNDDLSISWLTRVHTLANATAPLTHEEIASNTDRHILTRSFKCRRYVEPDYREFSLAEFNQIILATDGFWADLSFEDQSLALKGEKDLNGLVQDDTSVLLIS